MFDSVEAWARRSRWCIHEIDVLIAKNRIRPTVSTEPVTMKAPWTMYNEATALRIVVSKPGPKPPNQALTMTPGKNVMKGIAVPRRDCSANRPSSLPRKQMIPAPYRTKSDRLATGFGWCFRKTQLCRNLE